MWLVKNSSKNSAFVLNKDPILIYCSLSLTQTACLMHIAHKNGEKLSENVKLYSDWLNLCKILLVQLVKVKPITGFANVCKVLALNCSRISNNSL